jgi:hypothetical protein
MTPREQRLVKEAAHKAFREGALWGYVYGHAYQLKIGGLRSLKAANHYVKETYPITDKHMNK